MPPKPVEDYRYFVALVLVEDGSLQFRSSQDMKPYKRVVLEDAYHRFNEVMSDYIQQPGQSLARLNEYPNLYRTFQATSISQSLVFFFHATRPSILSLLTKVGQETPPGCISRSKSAILHA